MASEENNKPEKIGDIHKILSNYRKLLENQAKERDLLLRKVDEISVASKNTSQIDSKMNNLVKLLMDIKQQVIAISSLKSEIEFNESLGGGLLDDKEIESVAIQVEEEEKDLSDKISILEEEIEFKETLIDKKDDYITELNEQLELLAFEKSQLISKLDELSKETSEWGEQIDLLQKLAVSDPRYKAIDTLKKHGTLSEIQLAFSMGTSIGQVKRYAEDLIKLELIKRDSTGKYIWIGDE